MSNLVTQTNGDVMVVYFTAARILDDPQIQQLGEDLIAVANRAETGKVLLNFEKVKFMSSAMLGKLMLLNKKCKAESIMLKLSNITPDIMKVFKMLRLHKVVDIYPAEEKALAAFAKKGFFS